MATGEWTLFLVGHVIYRDAFDQPRYIEFCEGVGWRSLGEQPITYPAGRHNNAD
jgi:hypothetical protein